MTKSDLTDELTVRLYKKDEVTNSLTIMIEQVISNVNEVIGNIPTIEDSNLILN